MKKLTQEEFTERMKLCNDKVTVIGEYNGDKEPVLVRCNECGEKFYARPGNLLHGSGHKKCSHKMSHEHFAELAKLKNSKLTVIGKYTGMHDDILVKCNECGEEFFVTAQTVLMGCGHQKCWYKKNTYSDEEFKKLAKEKNKHITVIGEYTGGENPIRVKCNYCGKEYNTPACNVLRGYCHNRTRCREAAHGKRRKKENIGIDELKRRCAITSPNIEIIGEFEAWRKKILVRCKKCGRTYKVHISHILRKGVDGCKYCNSYNNSVLERQIRNLLDRNRIDFVSQKTFDWLKYKRNLRLDFYLPEFGLAIECQGEQHFKNTGFFRNHREFVEAKKRDELKRKLCEKMGIKVLYFASKFINESLYKDAGYKVYTDEKELLAEIKK
jgi:uncharacterized Zn finger protein